MTESRHHYSLSSTPISSLAQAPPPTPSTSRATPKWVVPDAPPTCRLTTDEVWYIVLKGKHPGVYLGL